MSMTTHYPLVYYGNSWYGQQLTASHPSPALNYHQYLDGNMQEGYGWAYPAVDSSWLSRLRPKPGNKPQFAGRSLGAMNRGSAINRNNLGPLARGLMSERRPGMNAGGARGGMNLQVPLRIGGALLRGMHSNGGGGGGGEGVLGNMQQGLNLAQGFQGSDFGEMANNFGDIAGGLGDMDLFNF